MTHPFEHAAGSSEPGWVLVRGDGALGSARRIAWQLLERAPDDPRPLVVMPNPRWVPEAHMEQTLSSVLEADPGLDAVVGWWRWTDAKEAGPSSRGPTVPATVRVGGRAGDDLSIVDLLARPASVGPIAIRPRAVGAIESLRDAPADAVLDCASTWAIASLLAAGHMRVGSLPRTCSTRTRTIAEDPESLRPIGLAWLVQFVLERAAPEAIRLHERRELLARWGAAPVLRPEAGAAP